MDDRLFNVQNFALFQQGELALAIFFRQMQRMKVEIALADDFLLRSCTELRQCRSIHQDKAALAIFGVEHFRHGVDEGAQKLTLIGERFLDAFAFGDVLHDSRNAHRSALLVADQLPALGQIAHLAVGPHDAIFDLQRLQAGENRLLRCTQPLYVVGVDATHKSFVGDRLIGRPAENAARLFRPFQAV